MIIFYCITFYWILLTEYSTIMCHPCSQAIISHQDLVCLNSNLFMNVAKVFYLRTSNVILPWSFPVKPLPVLFCYLLNTYDHSILKVFIISQPIVNIFQPICFKVLHDLHGHDVCFYCFSAFLNSVRFSSCFILRGKSFHIFGSRNFILFVPLKTLSVDGI